MNCIRSLLITSGFTHPRIGTEPHWIARCRLPWSRKLTNFCSRIGTRRMMASESRTYEKIDPSILVEEETLPGYLAQKYFPARIGQTFNKRYKVVGKLGYGSASTVWLCRDLLSSDTFVVLKIYINNSKVHRELPMYQHLQGLDSQHDGRDRIRRLLGHFEVQGPHGQHLCLVHEPLGISLAELRQYLPDGIITTEIMRETFRYILRGISFLHEEAKIIHTGGSSAAEFMSRA